MNNLSYRDTWADVSLSAIDENVKQFKNFIKPSTKLMAVVKADGYGHGAIEVSKTAVEAGADYLAVAILDEALELRNAGITVPILVLGYTPVHSVKMAIMNHVSLTVFSHEVLNEVIHQAGKLHQTARVHLKIDSGMTRIGLTSKTEALELAKKAINTPFVNLEGIFTHFAIADQKDNPYTREQFTKFMSFVEYLEQNQIHIPLKHCCNSAGTMNFPEMHLDMVRVGIALYGLYPDSSLKRHSIELKQAMSLKTKIVALKKVQASQPIGYGCTFVPQDDCLIGTLPIGYADGFSRLLSNRGNVVIRNSIAPVKGRVCMDQTMIDVSRVPNITIGDEVTLFGYNDEGYFYSVDEIASMMGTINYEVVCLIGKRIPRVYTKLLVHTK
ncbi:alanine racemase [Bacillus timonensis]|uniref:alanine racemase n=1 Tax=Bacillus timonensis TaxID=1033734 RepID=UPI000288338B|nr:alanine racemase [Bacillus timonensis]